MKIFSIFICKETYDGDVKLISSCFNLSSFSFLERNAIKEVLAFIVKSITPKLDFGKREIISHDKFLIFSFKWADGTTILAACDKEYPSRSAFSCINELYYDLNKKYLNTEMTGIKEQIHIKELQDYIKKYKDPLVTDSIFESQIKVERASEAMHVSLRSLLDRGENLDILLQKSQDLSDYSKKLFKTSKKTNKSCCNLQ
ncbi:SNARE protein [Cryptosporidium ryanae]|uniref:SNARE protein n=1 Tax=Cryptosporidium ryanae TaxID=515981 RepID=UPI00351A88D8|nr:SNARE protein [Cryptosporidium ryanae]